MRTFENVRCGNWCDLIQKCGFQLSICHPQRVLSPVAGHIAHPRGVIPPLERAAGQYPLLHGQFVLESQMVDRQLDAETASSYV